MHTNNFPKKEQPIVAKAVEQLKNILPKYILWPFTTKVISSNNIRFVLNNQTTINRFLDSDKQIMDVYNMSKYIKYVQNEC